MLDDGTTTGRVVLRAAALDLLPLLEPDDAISAVGRVEQLGDGPAVVVDDPGGIIEAGDPGGPEPAPGASSAVAQAAAAPAGQSHMAVLTTGSWLDAGAVGVATLGFMSAASLAFTLLRRRHVQRRIATRIAVRLASLDAPSGRSPGPAAPGADRFTFD
jgi:hypothetical protein